MATSTDPQPDAKDSATPFVEELMGFHPNSKDRHIASHRRSRWLLTSAAAVSVVIAVTLTWSRNDGSGAITGTPSSTTTTTAPTTSTTADSTTTTTTENGLSTADSRIDLPTVDARAQVTTISLPSGFAVLGLDADPAGALVDTGPIVFVDAATNQAQEVTRGGTAGGGPFSAVFDDTFWYLDAGALGRFDPATATAEVIADDYPGDDSYFGASLFAIDDAAVVAFHDSATGSARIDRFDAESAEKLSSVELPGGPRGTASAGHGHLWETTCAPWRCSDQVLRIDPLTGEVVPIERPQGGSASFVVGDDEMWIVGSSTIERINLQTLTVTPVPGPWERLPILQGGASGLLGSGVIIGDLLFVPGSTQGPDGDWPVPAPVLFRIDLSTRTLDAQIDLGTTAPVPRILALGGDTLWFGGDGLDVARVPVETILGPAS